MIRSMSQLFTNCEMSAFDKLGVVDNFSRLLDFNLMYFLYFSLENFGSTTLDLETLVLFGRVAI